MLEKTLCEITHADTLQFPMIKSRMNLIAKCGGYKCDQKFIYNKQCIIEYFPLSTNNYRLSPPGNKFTSRTEVVMGEVSMVDDKGGPLEQKILFQEHFESSRRL